MGIKAVEGKSEAFNNLKKDSSRSLKNKSNSKIQNVAFEKMPQGIIFGHLVIAPSGSLPLKFLKKERKKKKKKKKKPD